MDYKNVFGEKTNTTESEGILLNQGQSILLPFNGM